MRSVSLFTVAIRFDGATVKALTKRADSHVLRSKLRAVSIQFTTIPFQLMLNLTKDVQITRRLFKDSYHTFGSFVKNSRNTRTRKSATHTRGRGRYE